MGIPGCSKLHPSSRSTNDLPTGAEPPKASSNNKLLIAELVALLTSRSRISRQQIILFVDALKVAPQVEVIHFNTELDATAWILLKARTDKEWSLVDVSSFVVMTKYGMTEALTTDHHFTQAGFIQAPKL